MSWGKWLLFYDNDIIYEEKWNLAFNLVFEKKIINGVDHVKQLAHDERYNKCSKGLCFYTNKDPIKYKQYTMDIAKNISKLMEYNSNMFYKTNKMTDDNNNTSIYTFHYIENSDECLIEDSGDE